MKFSNIITTVVGLAMSTGAFAATQSYSFKLVGAMNAEWTTPVPPPVTFEFPNGFDTFADGTFDGLQTLAPMAFFTGSGGGGLELFPVGLGTSFYGVGEQLFIRPPAPPVFKLGTFDLFDPLSFNNLFGFEPTKIATLTISLNTVAPNNVIPEPASWAMMIAGFGLVGSALRRRTPRAI